MTTSPYPRRGGDDGADRRIIVNAGRLWTGGLATAVVAALAGLAATGLMHLLLLSTPQPWRFFARSATRR